MKEVYFIGIGGIGMSAIARYYNSKGYKVSGYDRTPSALTAALENEGIAVHYDERPDLVPADRDGTLVVYTPAIPEDMAELVYVREKGYRLVKRSRILGEISEGMRCLAVAGTHGKTTTSTLLGHIFKDSGLGCNAFLGGISKNYGTNLLLAPNNIIVAEADEFDRSFLQLHPEIAVITAMDADHLDIYNDLGHVHEAFRQFASQVSGTIVAKLGLPIGKEYGPEKISAKVLRYSLDDPAADYYAFNLKCDPFGCWSFSLHTPMGDLDGFKCGVPGIVNVENSVAASAAALCFGMNADDIRAAVESFEGVKRRFDIHYNNAGTVYIDDYAHHPEELSKAIGSIRGMFPSKSLVAIFQPHLYTRTRDFAPQFASVLGKADKVILLDIYPAREEPIPGVSAQIILDAIKNDDKVLLHKEELVDYLAEHVVGAGGGQTIVSFGAGDIDRLVEPIERMLREKLG